MAYFRQNESPDNDWQDDWASAYPADDPAERELDERETEERRKARWQVFAGVSDFFGVIAGAVVILLLTALLVSLFSWLRHDIAGSFELFASGL